MIKLDTEKAVASLGGNTGLYKKVLVRFKDGYSTAHDILAGHIAAGELPEAERMAHTIKGLAGNIGGHELVLDALNIEIALKENRLSDMPPLLAKFQATLADTLDAISKVLSE